MAITTVERTNILKLVVAMFNAPAGSVYLSEITSVFEANGRNLSALAQTLSNTGAFKALNPNFQSPQEFAAKFLTPYGLQNNATAVDFIVSKVNAGINKGQIGFEAASAIDAYTGTDAAIIAAKAIQNNKTSVAEFYSVTKAVPQTDLAQLQAAFAGVTAAVSSVAAANASIDGTTSVSTAFNLTTGVDSLFGTAGADTFTANVLQNSLGQQVNSLGSGDSLNGGGGIDTLSAKVTAGVFAGGPSASTPIQPITKSIEIIKLQANNAEVTRDAATTEVYVNARDMSSISKITSNYSDANLVVQNLTTLNDQGNATRLANMTVGMEYTGNRDTRLQESDASFYFDQDYLSRDLVFSNPSINLRLMNEDAYDVTFGTASFRPLTSVFVDKLDITLNGVGYSLAQFIPENRGPTGRGTEIETYDQLLAAVQAALVALKAANPTVSAVQSLTANFGPDFLSDISPVLNAQRVGRSISITAEGQTNGVNNALVINPTDLVLAPAKAIRTDAGDIGNNNRFERAGNTPSTQSTDLLTINVALEKAGLAGAGGELLVGSMFKDSTNTWQDQFAGKGIERFVTTVSGGNDKPSSLSGLHSTGNNLREVIVSTNAAQTGTFAALTIGNSNTDVPAGAAVNANLVTPLGKVAPGSIAVPGVVFAPTVNNANALKDVRVFNAADLKGDLTLFAGITAESVAKYMTLTDGAPQAATDNIAFQYTGGTGNDYINLFLDKANLAAAGTTTREDFSLTVNGGAGNDEIVIRIGDGNVAPGENWYQNSKINANLTVSGGLGNDTIRTLGAGDFVINGNEGNDTIYANNTGAQAVYVFNVADGDTVAAGNQFDINNLLSQTAASQSAVNALLGVNFKGLTAFADVANSRGALANVTITDLSVNQAIKAAINLDPVLSKLLIAEDGPGRSLVVRSLVDGLDVAPADLVISFGTTGPLSAAQSAQTTPVTLFAVAAAVGDGYLTTNFAQSAGANLNGSNSTSPGDHIINGGTGNDVIVLSTTNDGASALGSSNDTVVFSTGFGNDTVVNFGAGAPTTNFGADVLNFTALGGTVGGNATLFGQGTVVQAANSVSVVATTTANNNIAAVGALYADDAAAQTQVYVAVDTVTNIGSVYSIFDTAGVAAGSVTAVLVGTLNLADTLYSSLVFQNVA